MTDNEWYERERAAFIAWWESEGQEKFGATPTMAAGAGWLAKAEAVRDMRIKTIEECARVCDEESMSSAEQLSEKIRALKRCEPQGEK